MVWERSIYRLDLARVNNHDTDLGVDQLATQAVGEAAYGGLGCAVDRAAGVGLAASNGANVDDVAGATVGASEERGQDSLRDVDETRHISIEHHVDILLGDIRRALEALDETSGGRFSGVSSSLLLFHSFLDKKKEMKMRGLQILRIVDENVNVFIVIG